MNQNNLFSNIIGNSPKIKALLRQIEKVSSSPTATVLIRGESGTGKELVARATHATSPMAEGPFIELNCAAIPENLLEAELFGYERGAFTDARTQKKGLLELANGGTIFLDEIGAMSMNLQAKLLKVIDEKTFRRLGGLEEIRVTTRIIAATNVNLEESIANQRFREDLYYRLNVMSIELPPLREREDDVLILAEHFIQHYNTEYSKRVQGLSPGAARLLQAYRWPGNVRELKNVIERSVLLESKEILEAEDLSIDRRMSRWARVLNRESEAGRRVPERRDRQLEDTDRVSIQVGREEEILVHIPESGVALEAVERCFLEEALRMTRWNARRAARLLHLSYDTFRYRMQKHGLR